MPRARVSRETRLLLLTVVVSLAALLALARVRFPEQPTGVNPVTPLLSQLAAPRGFDDLAAEVARVEALILPAVDAISLADAASPRGAPAPVVPAFRFRDDRALALVDGGPKAAADGALVGYDPGSGLTLFSRPPSPTPLTPGWTAPSTPRPGYLVAVLASPGGLAVRPVFVGGLPSLQSVIWSTSVWGLDAGLSLDPGTLLFTTSGAFIGLVAEEAGGLILVPASAVIAAADRLGQARQPAPGALGLALQRLPDALALATGSQGLIVSWVDPEGPAAELAEVMDIVEGIDTESAPTMEMWEARRARLGAGDRVSLRLRRDGVVHAVTIVAAERLEVPAFSGLGLTLRAVPGVGSEVTAVEPRSAGERAGFRVGDVVTQIGDVQAPIPSRVADDFTALESGGLLLTAVARTEDRLVLALVKP